VTVSKVVEKSPTPAGRDVVARRESQHRSERALDLNDGRPPSLGNLRGGPRRLRVERDGYTGAANALERG
jgi:hypothetical protein